MKEIPKNGREDIYTKPTGKVCPNCGGDLYYRPVGCPDGKIGCLVIHMGYWCIGCGKQFTD